MNRVLSVSSVALGLCLGVSSASAVKTVKVKNTDAVKSIEGMHGLLSHISKKVAKLTGTSHEALAKESQLAISGIRDALGTYDPLAYTAQVERTQQNGQGNQRKKTHTIVTLIPKDAKLAETGSKIELDYEHDKKTGEISSVFNEYNGEQIARRLSVDLKNKQLEYVNSAWQNLDTGQGMGITIETVKGMPGKLKVERGQTEFVETVTPSVRDKRPTRSAVVEAPKNLKADPTVRISDDIADAFTDVSSRMPAADASDLMALQAFIYEILKASPTKTQTTFKSIKDQNDETKVKVEQSAVRADLALLDAHPNLYATEIPNSQPSLHTTRQRTFTEEGTPRDTIFLTLRFMHDRHRIVRNLDTGALSYTVTTTTDDGKEESIAKSFSLGPHNRPVRQTRVKNEESAEDGNRNAEIHYLPALTN